MTARLFGWAMTLWTLALLAIVTALTCFGQGQGNIGGILIASNFTGWSVGQGNNGNYNWTSPTFCTVTAGGTTFNAFTVGVPVYLSDSSNPSTSEVVTPTAVVINNSGCSLRINPVNQHQSFYFRTATAGLGEAIGYANSQHFVVTLTPQWQQLGGLTSMITSSTGNTNVSILDQRTSIAQPYTWNGSAYVLNGSAACAGGCVTQLNGITNAVVLQGDGTISVTPSGQNIQLHSNGGSPSGSAGGSLNGTYPNPGLLNLTQAAATAFFSGLSGCGTTGWVFSPQSGTCVAQSGGTWPALGDVVISNGSSSPAGLAPVNGDCLLGSGGVWTVGACGIGSVTAIGVTTANGVSGTSSGGSTPSLTIVLGAITPSSIVDTGLSASAAPICPNGSGGAFTTSGCTAPSNGLSGMTAGQIPVAATATSVTSSLGTTGTGNVVRATSPTIATPNLQSPVITTLITGPGAFAVDGSGNVTGASFYSAGPATGIAGLGTTTFTLGASGQVGSGASSATCSSSVVCDSFSGTLGFTSGTGSFSTGTILTVNLPGTRTNVPTCIVTVRAGATYLAEDATAVNSAGTVTIPITVGVALSASTAYHLKYLCDGL